MTKEKFLKMITRVGDGCQFEIKVDWDELTWLEVWETGIEYLNNLVDEYVHHGYLLEGLSYTPVRIEGRTIIVRVDVESMEEFLKED